MEEKLTRKEEELLLKFLDSETGFFETKRARSLIASSSAARRFAASIDRLGIEVEDWHAELVRENRADRPDLWDRVERRIEEEERAEVFLGRRESQRFSESRGGVFWSSVKDAVAGRDLFGKGLWAAAGSLVTASLILIAAKPEMLDSLDMPLVPARVASAGSAQHRFGGSGVYVKSLNHPVVSAVSTRGLSPRQLELVYLKRARRRFEANRWDDESSGAAKAPFVVEWIKSDGQLSLIPAPRKGSTVIWVKRGSSRPGIGTSLVSNNRKF